MCRGEQSCRKDQQHRTAHNAAEQEKRRRKGGKRQCPKQAAFRKHTAQTPQYSSTSTASTMRYRAKTSSDHQPNHVPGMFTHINPKQPKRPICLPAITSLNNNPINGSLYGSDGVKVSSFKDAEETAEANGFRRKQDPRILDAWHLW